MSKEGTKKLSIFLLNCDWRDIFRESFGELREKLIRDRLAPDANEFFIVSWARKSYSAEKENIRTVHMKTRFDMFRPILDLASLFLVPSTVKKSRNIPDLWVTYDFGFLPTLWLMKKRHGGRIIMCINNQPRIYSKTRRFGVIKSVYSYLVERLFKGIPDEYFTINETMRSYLQQLGVNEKDIHVFAMDTIERDREYIPKAQRGIVRKRYGLPENAKIILSVARLEAEKNHFALLQNFAALGVEHHLFILGRGSLQADLEKEAERLGIRNRLFLPGFVGRDDIWNFYMDADAFVLLSKAEALGVVFWEAMYAGVPCIGSDADGIRESLGEDGDRGRIWTPAMGREGFVERVLFCLEPSPARSAMLERAREYVSQKISNKIIVNDIV